MAPGSKVAVDFDQMIKADREKRKNQSLAKEIFGRKRRQSAPAAGASRKPGSGPSLASRVGIAKASTPKQTARSTAAAAKFGKKAQLPAGNVDADWTHDLHALNNPASSIPTGPSAKNGKFGRKAHLQKLLNASASSPNLNAQFNVSKDSGLSIRGIAGPCVVQAQNFAPGTTAADIESAMLPVGGKILACKLIATSPSVIAEIVFETKEGANCVIDTFHNQTADGRVLNLFIVPVEVSLNDIQPSPAAASAAPAIPLGPRADIERSNARSTRYGDTDRYSPRDDNRNRRNGSRGEVVDGSYGFDDNRMDTDEYDKPRPLYSDNMGGRDRDTYRDGRDRGRRGDSRDRGRGGDRGRGYR